MKKKKKVRNERENDMIKERGDRKSKFGTLYDSIASHFLPENRLPMTKNGEKRKGKIGNGVAKIGERNKVGNCGNGDVEIGERERVKREKFFVK